MSNVSTTIQMSCHVSCHVSSHIEAQLSQTSQHISALYAAATMLIKPVARQAWQAQSAQIQGIASNSFEQLGLSWTALSCFQRHSKAFQSPTWSELVLIALLSSVMLCQTCRWSLPWQCFWGQLSHAKAIAPLASPAHSKPMLNFCAWEVAASYIFSTYWCRLHILHHIATSCPKSLELSST